FIKLDRGRFEGCLRLRWRGFSFAFADPAFNTKLAIHSIGFGETILDISPKSVQRHSAPVVLLNAGQLRATQPPGTTNLNSFSSEIFGCLQCLLHGAPEGNATLQLQSYVLGDELRVDFRLLYFMDIYIDFFSCHSAEFFLELVNFRPFAANDDSRPRCHDRN